MREDLQSNLQIRNWMMELADLLIPRLKQRIIDDDGNKARYISVHDLVVDFHDHQEVIEFHCNVHYLSDVGDFEQQLIIRYFHSKEHYQLESAQYYRLLSRTNFFDHIKPVELLLRDEEDQVLVYNAPVGQDLADIREKDAIYYFQLGHLLAILHGGETLRLEARSYTEMSRYLMNQLGFGDQVKELFEKLLDNQYNLVEASFAGYDPATIIDTDNLKFSPLDDNITKQKIMNGEAYYIEILPSLIPRVAMDRMEDFATIFTKSAYKEYNTKGEISDTVINLISALEGYEIYYNEYSTSPFDKIYPNGISLDLHILISFWMFATEMQDIPRYEISNEDMISFSLHILYDKPFQL